MKMHPHSGDHKKEAPRHNMLVVGEKSIFLSHLPMFMAPHNFQVILEATFTKKGSPVDEIYFKDRHSHQGTKMYTLEPEVLKLASLFTPGAHQSPRRSFKGTVFRGHLERGGQAIAALTNIDINVKKVVYAAKLGPGLEKPEKLTYHLLGNDKEFFLAHVVGAPPDFDQILSVTIEDPPAAEDLDRGVRVVFLDRVNSAADRIKEKESVQGQGHAAGAHQFLALQIKACVEFYFEEGELSSPPTFDPTAEEKKAGFGD
jgi:hypothetical protein